MIIEVQGAKTDGQTAKAGQPFAFESGERPSRLPHLIGLVFLGIAAYLKGAWPAAAEEPTDEPTPAPGDAAQRAPSRARPAASNDVDADDGGRAGRMEPSLSQYDGLVGVLPLLPILSLPGRGASHFTVTASNDNQGVGGPGPVSGDFSATPSSPAPQIRKASAGDGYGASAAGDPGRGPTRNNHAPQVKGTVRLNDVVASQIVLIGLTDLLVNAVDPDGDALGVVDVAISGGGQLMNLGGVWMFQASAAPAGEVILHYRVTDGFLSVAQQAIIQVVPALPPAAPADEPAAPGPALAAVDLQSRLAVVEAASAAGVLEFGTAGNDIIVGSDLDDVLAGGAGNDIVSGLGGDDELRGEAGDDTLIGGAGDDHLDGGEGEDVADYSDAASPVAGDLGSGVASGAEVGNDTLASIETLIGGGAADTLTGGDGDDVLIGNAGDDNLAGNAGDDSLFGNAGDDRIVGGLGADRLDGGLGHDTLDYAASAADLSIDLIAGTATGSDIGSDAFADFESVEGGAGDDTFVVNIYASVRLVGGPGEDLFVFTVTNSQPLASAEIISEILDFVVGDRIRVNEYELSKRAALTDEELFGAVYDNPEEVLSDLPIRVRHELDGALERTVVEADFDRDEVYEFALHLQGHILPVIAETSLA